MNFVDVEKRLFKKRFDCSKCGEHQEELNFLRAQVQKNRLVPKSSLIYCWNLLFCAKDCLFNVPCSSPYELHEALTIKLRYRTNPKKGKIKQRYRNKRRTYSY